VPVEGYFFCDPDRNNNNNDKYISIGIHYPIPTLIKTAAIFGIGSGAALIGIITFGISIACIVFKRSHRRARPRLYTEDNPAYGVTLGVRYKPSRKTDSSPTHTQEPVYDTIR
ncbi:hypothetical protein GBAR_LOCUS12948, partial [Geodia barretti]